MLPPRPRGGMVAQVTFQPTQLVLLASSSRPLCDSSLETDAGVIRSVASCGQAVFLYKHRGASDTRLNHTTRHTPDNCASPWKTPHNKGTRRGSPGHVGDLPLPVGAAVAPLEEASPWKRPLRGTRGLVMSTGRDVDGDRLAAAVGGDGGASRAALRRLQAAAGAGAGAAAAYVASWNRRGGALMCGAGAAPTFSEEAVAVGLPAPAAGASCRGGRTGQGAQGHAGKRLVERHAGE